MGRFFIRPEEPNLAAFRQELDQLLKIYSITTEGRLGFGDYRGFELTPQKRYTARAIIPAVCDSKRIEDLYVLLFKPGDGTGDESTYKFEEVDITEISGLSEQRNLGAIPRKKGCQTEAFLPFGTATENKLHLGVVCLDLLTLDLMSKKVIKLTELGIGHGEWHRRLSEGTEIGPYAGFTVGYVEQTGNYCRIGDPHAVRFREEFNLERQNTIQMVGFLELSLDTPSHEVFTALSKRKDK